MFITVYGVSSGGFVDNPLMKKNSEFIEGLTWRIEKVFIEEERAITDKGIKSTIVRVWTLKPHKNHLIATSLIQEAKEG